MLRRTSAFLLALLDLSVMLCAGPPTAVRLVRSRLAGEALWRSGIVEHRDPPLAELVAGTVEDVWRFTRTVGSEQARAYAREWIRDADPGVREVGVIALGSVALNCAPALEELLDHADAGCADGDAGVRAALAQTLGNQSGEQRCVPVLLRLLDDPDVEVRRIAIGGLPIVLDEPAADHPAVTALIGLLTDPEPTLRDWAAFSLGTQLDVDSPQIRAGLRSLLSDQDTVEVYPAAEAALGLARRNDPAGLTAVADRLTRPDPTSLWLRAAAEFADPRLLPALLQLRAPDNEPDDPWVEQLEDAIARCTAGRVVDDDDRGDAGTGTASGRPGL